MCLQFFWLIFVLNKTFTESCKRSVRDTDQLQHLDILFCPGFLLITKVSLFMSTIIKVSLFMSTLINYIIHTCVLFTFCATTINYLVHYSLSFGETVFFCFLNQTSNR